MNKKDFILYKSKSNIFFYKWLKCFFFSQSDGLTLFWILPKKYIVKAVVRNRFKRWGRENLKNSSITNGMFIFVFLRRNKEFYRSLGHDEFNKVFTILLDQSR